MSTEVKASPAKVWFSKGIASQVFLVADKPVPFEVIGNNIGVIGLDPSKPDEAALVAVLTEADHNGHLGGVSLVSEAAVVELKKNHPLKPSGTKSPDDILKIAGQAYRPPVRAAANPAEVSGTPAANTAMRGLEKPIDEAAIAALEAAASAIEAEEVAEAAPKVPTKKLSTLLNKGKPKEEVTA